MSSERVVRMSATPIDKLDAAIMKILNEYSENITENVQEAAKKVTKAGVKAVKGNSRAFGGTGNYAAGWTSKFESGRLSGQGFIYNQTVPGLPHLLEHGHALRNGGRAPGRAHIKPVEEEVIKKFEKAVRSAIDSA